VLERKGDEISIRQHITNLKDEENMNDIKACKTACGEMFPDICEECDPDKCQKKFVSTSDLKAAVNLYCDNPQGWESNDLFQKYGCV
jgi:hypothetical protein